MSAEFVYQNGSYQLRSVNPGNIWYKQRSRFIPKKFFQKNANNIGKSLLFKPGYDTIFGRMEVGFFFMPKIGQHRKLPRNTLTKNIKRGGSCAYKNHIGVYRMQAA